MEEGKYTPEESKIIAQQYKELLRISYQTFTEEDKKLIRKAFDIAVDAHRFQRRKSGEPYIYHPIAVAKIVAEQIGLDAVSIAAALLHDVVEDTNYTDQDMKDLFGEVIAKIVRGLTKISHLNKENTDISLQAENFRKMLLTLNDDVRVILIKIADRLHNMQTMDAMPAHKQEKIALETLYIYAPLAYRVGLFNIKTELEDLGLKYAKPKSYYSVLSKVEETQTEQEAYIDNFVNQIQLIMNQENIDCYVKGRPKSIYSIYKKMKAKEISYEEVYDKFAIRIIYKGDEKNEKFLAWRVYSIITDRFRPNPTRLRDWISFPKSTGYEALHVTVMGPKSRWVEVQIRSERMHEIAERGYAAHFKYKHGEQKEQGIESWLNKLREVLEGGEGNAVEMVEDIRLDLAIKEIFVFTPDGEIKSLPKGACPIDFAFSIHTQVGMRTRGAKVNNKLVPLNHRLKSGDIVEIITSENATPNANWLDYIVSAKARSKVKSSLQETKKQKAEEGKEILQRKLKQLKITLNESVVNDMVSHFKVKTSQDIFYQVATNEINNTMLKEFAAERKNFIFKIFRKKSTQEEISPVKDSTQYDTIVFGREKQELIYSFPKCCNPIPGDSIFGFTSITEGIKVHKKNCPNALFMHSNYSHRILTAQWVKSGSRSYEVSLKISGLNRKGLVGDIMNYVNSLGEVDVTDVHFNSSKGVGVFEGEVTLSVNNNGIVKVIIDNLPNINGIEKVSRM